MKITETKKQVLHCCFWAIFSTFTACSGLTRDSKGSISGSSQKPIQNTAITGPDSTVLPQPALTQIYTKAIGEFIRAVYKKDKINEYEILNYNSDFNGGRWLSGITANDL